MKKIWFVWFAVILCMFLCNACSSRTETDTVPDEEDYFEGLYNASFPISGACDAATDGKLLYYIDTETNSVFRKSLSALGDEDGTCLYTFTEPLAAVCLDSADSTVLWTASENGIFTRISLEETNSESYSVPDISNVRKIRACGDNILVEAYAEQYDPDYIQVYFYQPGDEAVTDFLGSMQLFEGACGIFDFCGDDTFVFSFHEMKAGMPDGRNYLYRYSLKNQKPLTLTALDQSVPEACFYDRSSDTLLLTQSTGWYTVDPSDGTMSFVSPVGRITGMTLTEAFLSGNCLISFDRNRITENGTVRYDGMVSFSEWKNTNHTVHILCPGKNLNSSFLKPLIEDFQSVTGYHAVVDFLPEETYAEKLRLRLLEKDDSFDIFCIPDASADGLLAALTKYALYQPLNQFISVNDFFEKESYDYFRDALTDPKGNIYGIPLSAYCEVMALTDRCTARFGDTLTMERLYEIGDCLIKEGGGGLFYDAYDAAAILFRLETNLILRQCDSASVEQLQVFLRKVKEYKDAKVLVHSQYMMGTLPLMVSGTVNALHNYTIAEIPGLAAEDASLSVSFGDILCGNRFSDNTAGMDAFFSFLTENIYEDTNGLSGKDLDRYRIWDDFSADAPQSTFEHDPEERNVYASLDSAFPTGIAVTYTYPDTIRILDSVLSGEVSPESAAEKIEGSMREWMEE